jgi:hypothetical protein
MPRGSYCRRRPHTSGNVDIKDILNHMMVVRPAVEGGVKGIGISACSNPMMVVDIDLSLSVGCRFVRNSEGRAVPASLANTETLRHVLQGDQVRRLT